MTNWVIDIKGPNGVKHVEVPNDLVRLMAPENNNDPYQTAAWLAYTDLWMDTGI